MEVPTFYEFMVPTLKALHKMDGSASINEIDDEVIASLNLPSEVTERLHGNGSKTEVEYRLAWTRTYLKQFGLIDNSERGVWVLTPEGRNTTEVDPKDVVRAVQQKQKKKRESVKEEAGEISGEVEEIVDSEEATWRETLMQTLLAIDPSAFERLSQRILRESGFIEVEVTGRSGDGGIDGHGVMRLGGLISFTVLFQSKRHQANIGPNVVRDFRGAMIGRADKGLIITTAGFSSEARKEATRDGAPPIDLIDGQLLLDKLKELNLGVKTKQVEAVEVDADWFQSI